MDRFDAAPEVRALPTGAHGDLDPVDTAVVRLAERAAGGAADMTEQDLAEARALGLTDDEVLDVVLAAAARSFFSTALDAAGAELGEVPLYGVEDVRLTD